MSDEISKLNEFLAKLEGSGVKDITPKGLQRLESKGEETTALPSKPVGDFVVRKQCRIEGCGNTASKNHSLCSTHRRAPRARLRRAFELKESHQRYLARTFTPPFKMVECDECKGSGKSVMPGHYCWKCHGVGKTKI